MCSEYPYEFIIQGMLMKRLKKRVTSLVLVLALMLGMIPGVLLDSMTTLAATAGTVVDSGNLLLIHDDNTGVTDADISWTLTVNSSSTSTETYYDLKLEGYGIMKYSWTSTVPPWSAYAASVKTVSFSEGITTIQTNACADMVSLESVTIPDSVTTIGEYSFGRCISLKKIVMGSGLKTIEAGAFSGCENLTNVQLNEGLKTIESEVFLGCDNLSNLSIPSTVTGIGSLLAGGSAITSLTIPANVTSIEDGIFQEMDKLQTISVAEDNDNFKALDGVLYEMKDALPYRLIGYPQAYSTEESYTVEEGTQIIGEAAFHNNSNLLNVTFPETLISIRHEAFMNSALNKIIFSDSIQTVESWAFYNTAIQEVIIPDSITELGESSFGYCKQLKEVTIGSGLSSVNANVFSSSTAIETFTVSEENTYYNSINNVLYNEEQTELVFYAPAKTDTEYEVLDTVAVIANSAVKYANNLEKIYLPASLTEIKHWGISNNKNLKSIYFYGNAPVLEEDSTGNSNAIRYNAGDMLVYRIISSTGWDAKIWTGFTLAEWQPESTAVYEGTLGELSWKYESVDGTLTFMGRGAIPDFEVDTEQPWNAYVLGIQSIEAPQVTHVGDYAFYGARNVRRIQNEKQIISVGDYGFYECIELVFVELDSVQTIGISAFENAYELAGDLWLSNLTSLGANAFKNCQSVQNILLGGSLEVLENNVFEGCTDLEYLMLPDSILAIKSGALRNCTSLCAVNIPNHVEEIGEQAFAENTALEKIYFYGEIPQTFAENSFFNANSNLTFYYRKENTVWDALAGTWNQIPIQCIEEFYEAGEEHYSFSNNRESFGYPSGYHIPRKRYIDVLNSNSLGTYYYLITDHWQGSCFGMASSTLEFYENAALNPTSFEAEADNVFSLPAPGNKDAKLTQLIEAYQLSQFKIGYVKKCYDKSTYWDMIKKVEAFERSGGLGVDDSGEPVLLAVANSETAHAVVPVSVTQRSDSSFEILVYDPNYPMEFQTLIIPATMDGIVYQNYTSVTCIEYSRIVRAMSDVESYTDDSMLYFSVNKENASIANSEGKNIEQIEGAYKQEFIDASTVSEDGTKLQSFVVPIGDYTISANGIEKEEATNFYMATEENFVQITSTDERATISISMNSLEQGGVPISINLQSESEEQETTQITLMNEQGLEREIEIKGSSAALDIMDVNSFSISLPTDEDIIIDGTETALKNGKVSAFFETTAKENPLKAKEFTTSVSCNEVNELNGNIDVTIISNATEDVKAFIMTEYLDGNGNVVASYTEDGTLTRGLNMLSMSFEKVKTKFEKTEGNEQLSARLTVFTEEGKTTSITLEEPLTVLLTKQETDDKTPGEMGGTSNENNNNNSTEENNNNNSTEESNKDNSTVENGNASNSGQENSNIGKLPEEKPKEIAVTKVKASVKKIVLGVGEKYKMKTSVEPSNVTNKNLIFKTTSKKIKVNSKGVITAKKTGKAKVIIQSVNGKKATVMVVVKKAPKKITLNAKKKTLKKNKTFQIKVKLPKNTASNQITYTSNKKSVATVSSGGKVKAKKKGTATITVKTFNGKKAKLIIKVK